MAIVKGVIALTGGMFEKMKARTFRSVILFRPLAYESRESIALAR